MPEEGKTQPTAAEQPTQGNTKTNAPAGEFDAKEVTEGKGMAWMSYVGALVFIPFFVQKDNKYTHKHAVQGMNLFILEAIVAVGGSILMTVTGFISWILAAIVGISIWAIWVFLLVISIMGIVNAGSGKYKDLPLVSKIKFIKK